MARDMSRLYRDAGGGGGARVLREGGGERGAGARGDLQHGAHHRVQECHRQVSQMWRMLEKSFYILFCSIPNLVPEEKCRVIPKEACQTVFLNPTPTTVSR